MQDLFKHNSFEVVWVDIDLIKPYWNNPRNNKNAIAEVKKSLMEFGWQQPLVADVDNVLAVGHTRYEAAKEMGLKKVPVKYSQLSDDENNAYRIVDNRTSEFAEWDREKLQVELNNINKNIPKFDATYLGFQNELVLQDSFKIENTQDKEMVEILIKCEPGVKEEVIKFLDQNGSRLIYDVQHIREKQ